jgi:hypothetical protein
MAAGQRTVKIKFDGENNVGPAARSAERDIDKFGKGVTGKLAKMGGKIGDALSSAVEAIPPAGKLVAGVLVAGLAVALAPALGAAITSAVLLAVGGGALALGIKSALSSPIVKAAFDPLKQTAKTLANDFGAPFRGPLVRAAETLDKALQAMKPTIDQIGRALGPVVDDLAPAFAGFLKNALPGIQSAVEAAVPLFRMLADKLPGLGKNIGIFFDEIAQGGPGATAFFGDLIELIGKVLVGIGIAIGKLSSWYTSIRKFVTDSTMRFLEFRVKVINELGKLLEGATASLGWIPGIGPKLQKANRDFARFKDQANKDLAAIKDRKVRVDTYSNVAAVAKNVARTLAAIRDEKVYISIGSNIGQVVAGINSQIASIPGVKRRASGGPVSAGQSYLVGERGPELLTMPGGQNGTITPNRDLGGDTVFEVTINLADDVTRVLRLNSRDLKRRSRMQGARA